MKRYLFALAFLAAFGATEVGAVGFMIEIERGHETDALEVFMRGPTDGIVTVTECDGCPLVELRVTEDTLVYKSNRPVALSALQGFRGQPGVVFREIDTNLVTRIKIY